jgi:hypothetical protein
MLNIMILKSLRNLTVVIVKKILFFYNRAYLAIFFYDTHYYKGGDLVNKKKYRAFRNLYDESIKPKSSSENLSFYKVCGLKLKQRQIKGYSTSALVDLRNVLSIKSEDKAKKYIQDRYGESLFGLAKLSNNELALNEYAYLELGLYHEAASCHVNLLRKLTRVNNQQDSLNNINYLAQVELSVLDNTFEKLSVSNPQDLNISFYLSLLTGSGGANIKKRFLGSKRSKRYNQVVKNSKILIIGPGSNPEEVSNNEDFDIVVIMNYHGASERRDAIISKISTRNRPAIIVYYGNNASDLFGKYKQKISWLNKPDYVVVKSNHNLFQQKVLRNKNSRTLFSVDKVMVLGSGNFLQQCLYDILWFSPSSIKIVGFNFWTNNVAYDKGYKIIKSEESFKRYSFAAHNVISNWIFPKVLYKNGIIDCSDEVGRILDMDITDYMEALRRNYPYMPISITEKF